jgi:hypothetical protein
MPAVLRWCFGTGLAALLVGVPFLHFRAVYDHAKRLRVVTPGKFYRCGQLTVAGFRDAFERYHFRTVVNVQDLYPDPLIEGRPGDLTAPESLLLRELELHREPFTAPAMPESELCRQLGVRYVFLWPQLIDRHRIPAERPEAIDEWLRLLDDPSAYPVLLHCKAGLHRTGLLTAIYRMEYEGWGKRAAVRELKSNGFGEFACTTANDYLVQYIETYKPRRGAAPALSTPPARPAD